MTSERFMKLVSILVLGLFILPLGACRTYSMLEEQQEIDRAKLGERALTAERPIDIKEAPPANVLVEQQIGGTYEFTAPDTTTRLSQKNGDVAIYTFYMGRPKPTDKPIVTISVGPKFARTTDAAGYRQVGSRTYLLNGLPAQEYTGYTPTGEAFAELLITRAEGDALHALAVAKTAEERKVALDILASIKWQAR